MQKFEVVPSQKVIVVFGGVEYEVNKPKMGALRALEAKLDEARKSGGSGANTALYDFVVRCGLPEAVVDELDPEELEQVMAALTPAKKN